MPSKLWRVHAMLFAVMGLGIGFGSVIGKIGLEDINPIVFAFVRDLLATPILLLWSFATERKQVDVEAMKQDRSSFLVAAIFLFLSNICYTIGVKLSNAVIGAAWQASNPIFTTAIAMALRLEAPSVTKCLGIAIAFCGALFMILFNASSSSSSSSALTGNICFLINVSAYASYTIRSRMLLRNHRPLATTGTCFSLVTLFLFASVFVFYAIPPLRKSVMAVGESDGHISFAHVWRVPGSSVFALCYFVVFYSVLLYSVMAWANRVVAPSTVNAYGVFQPLAAAGLELVLLHIPAFTNAYPDSGLELPGVNCVGAVGILVGLGLLLLDDARMRAVVVVQLLDSKATAEVTSPLVLNNEDNVQEDGYGATTA